MKYDVEPIEAWHEDIGTVLWWSFPLAEPPYIGSPLHDDWPGYHTYWTPLPIPPVWPEEVEWANMIGRQ